MSEINPKYVDGEPVCNPDECGQYGYNSDVGSYCKILDNEWCFENCPCIPALRRDRDMAEAELERAGVKNAELEKEKLLELWKQPLETPNDKRRKKEVDKLKAELERVKGELVVAEAGWECSQNSIKYHIEQNEQIQAENAQLKARVKKLESTIHCGLLQESELKARVEELEDKKCLKHCAERITFAV